jgi:hypothetical protein
MKSPATEIQSSGTSYDAAWSISSAGTASQHSSCSRRENDHCGMPRTYMAVDHRRRLRC